LLDTGKLGSLREIERTDLRSVLHFMREYFQMKQESQPVNTKYVYGDQVDWA
jgi:hypothetical protein